jgi:glycosyltransferase involved in cell wall biosynthesis
MNKLTKKEISVIIPIYNDPAGLKDTLNSLVEQIFPKDSFEIIVADNGSTDDTLSVINNFINRYPKLIRRVQEKNIKSSYAARNKGISNAKGSVISFIDADMTVEKDWLKKVMESLQKNKTDCLVCNVQIVPREKSIFATYDRMVAFPIKKYVKELHFTPAGCLTIYKNIFYKIGLFDENLVSGGDREFGNRVHEAGYKIRYEPNIIINHPARSSLKQFLRKSFRIGRGLKQLSFHYPSRYNKMRKKILDPRNFLPKMSILRFTINIRGNKIWDNANSFQRIFFYLIYWLCCLSNYFGYIYESLFKIKTKKN